MRSRIVLFALAVLMSASAAAQTLTGTVRNATTGRPAAHDDVVLLNLMQGMNEAARTKTDAQGRFTFTVQGQGPHLVRANHQNVNYFRAAPPGTTSVEIQVYDVAQKLDGITGTVSVMRLQTDGGKLQGLDLYAVKNSSTPPRTLMNDRPFEFYLPDGAQIDQVAAESPGGNPVNASAVPASEKDRYYVVFPLRPGETRFQIAWHLPYSGQARLRSRFLLPYEHLAVVLPKSIQFMPEAGTSFSPMTDDTGASLQVASNTAPGKPIAFRISGTGMLQDSDNGAAQQTGGQSGMGPGGGLGAPIDTPDPLHNYRWPILGGLCAVLMAGAFYVVTRQKPVPAGANYAAPRVPSAPVARTTLTQERSATLLEALKEELFQLEVERQQGRISPEEYQKAKAALDQTIARAIARQK